MFFSKSMPSLKRRGKMSRKISRKISRKMSRKISRKMSRKMRKTKKGGCKMLPWNPAPIYPPMETAQPLTYVNY
jgi:hypothetical protein